MWWEENDEDQRAISITVIAKTESGFSRRLQALSKDTTFHVIIDGPYGAPKNMDLYDSFIFVSTGIGITSQLPYLKQLIARQDQGFRLRRICLIWEVEEKGTC
ncbi:hypothetical protein N7466_007310 [Penicillium verhagenii]|uniref:uncharacterized protein n=1 Tax=Penicillium verhagenii TaxID=1562060 RepID=UPI0025452FD1|nr:uncharacterized protein N7466_007310 [Penicillium verhagenii]KAJ5928354.1 hypothetical protein N7466_007310 [Penicillium verhagenii]